MSLKRESFQRALEEIRSLDADLLREVERLPRRPARGFTAGVGARGGAPPPPPDQMC
jgi:hypothetical protein